MAKFSGKTNIVHGQGADAIVSEYDPESGEYVVDVTGNALKEFREVAKSYGYSEVKTSQGDQD